MTEVNAWGTQISPMLTFSDATAAIDLYKTAFNAQLLWHLGDGGQVAVAGLSIDGAKFFLAHESLPHARTC